MKSLVLSQRVLTGLSRTRQGPRGNHPSILSKFIDARKGRDRFSTTCDATKIATCQEAYDLISQGGDKGYTYLDVRTAEEYSGGHVQGSVNIPVWLRDQATGQMAPNPGFMNAVMAEFPNKDTKLCVGCLSGKRSEQATSMLAEAGYNDLINMSEGYQGWCGAGLPTTS